MADDTKTDDEALEPTLEFGDDQAQGLEPVPAAQSQDITAAAKQEQALDDSILSTEDKKKVEEFTWRTKL